MENRLREWMQTVLSKADNNWWITKIPDDVRKKAEDRKSRRETVWPWHASTNLHPIHYVDFADYSKIILRKDNWKEIFKKDFRDESFITTRLKELEPIRNDIGHSRELTKNQKERLKLYAYDIVRCLE